MAIDGRERWRIVAGMALGLSLTAVLSEAVGHAWPGAWLVAPLGASAVILFALPSSPLAQPWAVVGGNLVSALVGIAVVLAGASWAPAWCLPALAAAAAVVAMLALRCLHPPGGAVALLVALGGVHDWRFAVFPVLTNSVLLTLCATAYSRATGKAYPHRSVAGSLAPPSARFTDADIDKVLARYNQVLDVPRDELHALLEAAETESYRRRLGELDCGQVMSREVVCVEFGTPLAEAWSLLRDRHIKALPVVDRVRRVVGVITLADFLRDLAFDDPVGPARRLRERLRPAPGLHSDKPEVVGQIMTRRVQVVRVDRSLASVVPVFASTGHHHLPVVDAELRLVGILTQTDVVRVLA